MKASSRILLSTGALCVAAFISSIQLDAAVPKKKNPTSKFYVADVEGQSQIDTGEKIEDLTKKSVHTAQGTVVETKKDSTNAMVFSNGTGIFFDSDTRLEVKKFVQEPFTPQRTDMEVEPSISQTVSFIQRGTVGLCTSKLVAGSSMVYRTSQGSISIRGRKVLIECTDDKTVVSLLEGDVTVRGGELDMGGQNLHPGQQAIITGGRNGAASTVKIQDIPPETRSEVDRKVSMACMAKNTVYFETAERKSQTGAGDTAFDEVTEEIVAVPTVPVSVPDDFTASSAQIGKKSS